jgi:hypothetical protein
MVTAAGRDRPAISALLQTRCRRCGLVVAFRGPMGWLSIRLPAAVVVWLINEVPPVGSCRGVARKRCDADPK